MRSRIDILVLLNLLLLLFLLVEVFSQGIMFALIASILGLGLFIHELFVFHGIDSVNADSKAKSRLRKRVFRSSMQTVVIVAIAMVYVVMYQMPLFNKLLETLF